ncbi:MAG: PAS domain S-box protein, partial [Gammaproteobacteria bacterium]|nr:PAS domain S-box protein [Gammaproteobacteria bacterium]
LTLLPALLLILYTGVEQRRLAAAAAQGDAMHVVQLAAGAHKEMFAETQRLVQLLAQLPAVREGSAAACSAFLTRLFKQDPAPRYSSFSVLRPNGDVFCSSAPLKRHINASDQAYYRRVMSSRASAIGDYQIGRITGRAIVVLAQPVLDAAGEVQAIVGAGIDLGWLNRLATEAKLPDGSTLTMIDQNGVVLVRYPDSDKWLGSSTANTPLFKIVRARGDGAIQAPGMDGVERLHAFTALRDASGGIQAHISVGIPTATVFVEANRILARNLVTLALVTALALATAWYGGNIFLLRQIGTLVGAARRLGRGDLSARTGLPHQGGEIGDLARSFDEMAEGLQARVAEVRHAEAEMRKLAGVTEQTDDVVLITDAEGIIEYVNPAYERDTGYRREEALGKKPNIVKSGKHGEGFYRALWQTIRAGKPFRGVFVNRRKDGTLYYEEKTITPLKNERGEITHFVSTGKDISERMHAERALRESESRLANAQRLARLGNWDWNLDSGELHWSEETFRIFGLDPRTAVPAAEDFLKAIHPDDRERVRAAAHRAIENNAPFSIEFRIVRPDGAERIVHEEAEIARDKTGKAVRMLGTTQDVTERKQAEDKITRLGRILDDSSNEIYVFSAESLRFVQVNRGAQRNLGYTMDELKSLTPPDIKPEFTRESFEALIAPLRRGEQEALSFVTNHRRKDGSDYPVEVQLQLMRHETPPVFVAIIQDITERRAAEERLSYLAYHDTLTRLPNRVLLLERLQQAMVDAERVNRLVAVMFLDLDRFKIINDTLGHHIGDALLKAVAERLKSCVRPGDIIARLGGDEFTVVLANVAHVDDVARVTRKIIDSFVQPFRVEDHDLFITTSIGITLYPFDEQNPEGLLKNADAAMYHAKESGRNVFKFFTSELNVRTERRLTLETALR